MLASVAVLASCSDRLDTLPDNRTTLDTPKKIAGSACDSLSRPYTDTLQRVDV